MSDSIILVEGPRYGPPASYTRLRGDLTSLQFQASLHYEAMLSRESCRLVATPDWETIMKGNFFYTVLLESLERDWMLVVRSA